MDIFFLLVSIILICFIIVVRFLDYTPSTRNLKKIVKYMKQHNPTIRSFSLGKNLDNNLYSNVIINENETIEVRENEYPIGLDNDYIVLKVHGDIVENEDGFTVIGFEFANFICPSGFHGPNCQPNPICDEGEEGMKTLTTTQFSAFNLNINAFEHTLINDISSNAGNDLIHKRIRAKCSPKGLVEFQACPKGTSLNEQLECVPYDICQDSLPGRKHNYKPFKHDEFDKELKKNDYYICIHENGNTFSKLRTCPEGSIFSSDSLACITESICYNKGKITLKNGTDEYSYIKCENDLGIKITCDEKIIIDEFKTISCKVTSCTPFDYIYSDIHTKYVYGETTCENGKPITHMCKQGKTTRKWEWEWAEKFKYEIPWPEEVLIDHICQPPTDDIITNSKIHMRWSDAMPNEHLFDIKTEEFICEKNEIYKWNYKTGVTHPMVNDTQLINPAAPCQNEILSSTLIPFPKLLYPPNTRAFIYLTVNTILDNYDNLSFWPRINSKNNSLPKYMVTTCKYTDSELLILTFGSFIPPRGFVLPFDKEEQNLILDGYVNATINSTRQHYFIATGQVETAFLYKPEFVAQYSRRIPLKTKIENTKQNITFSIPWHKMEMEIQILKNLIFDPQKVTFLNENPNLNKTIDAGYVIMSIEYINSTKSILKIGQEIIIEFNCSKYKEFDFLSPKFRSFTNTN